MMGFNDRRKAKQAKKAASATTKAQIGAMAKAGTLRATSTSPGQRAFSARERAVVKEEVRGNKDDFRPRKERYADAAKKVQGAADVKGFDGPLYRKLETKRVNQKQKKSWLPQQKKK
jgi:hypothetical protein